MVRIIKNNEKIAMRIYKPLIKEQIFCEKDQVVEIEYVENHRPAIRIFAGS